MTTRKKTRKKAGKTAAGSKSAPARAKKPRTSASQKKKVTTPRASKARSTGKKQTADRKKTKPKTGSSARSTTKKKQATVQARSSSSSRKQVKANQEKKTSRKSSVTRKSMAKRSTPRSQTAVKTAPRKASRKQTVASGSRSEAKSTPKKSATPKPKAKATPAPKTSKKPAQSNKKSTNHSKATSKSPTKKVGVKDRSELLRRLLDLRSGYQRAHDEPERKKGNQKSAKSTAERSRSRVPAPEVEIPVLEPAKPAKARKAKMRKRDLERIRKALESERDKISNDLEVLDEMTNSKDETGGIETNSFSIHLAEHATDNSTLETTLMQRHLIEERLSQVIEALKRMDDGEFGLCELCGDTITVERLVAKPFARLCIECRRNLESRRARNN